MAEALKSDTVLDFIRDNRGYLAEHFHIRKIGLFGSVVRNEQRSGSDIDLIVEFDDNTPDLYDLKSELRQFFGERFNCSVDIAREKYLKPYARELILSEAVYVE